MDLNNLIERLLNNSGLDERSVIIVDKRFGLSSPKTATLQELGSKYGITRERVRQLETQAFSEIRSSTGLEKELSEVSEFVRNYLNNVGGLRKDESLINDFHLMTESLDDEMVFGNKIRFIFEVINYPNFHKEDGHFHDFWFDDQTHCDKLMALHSEILKKLERIEHFMEIFDQAVKQHEVNEAVAAHYLSVSKEIGVGPYGDIGLSHWEEINPKTVRAKAFLLLKKTQKPLHFTEIAKFIGSHAPTVHNELIKDQRFVLVGRGTYTLK